MNNERQEYGEAFERYESMLRTWFVAYGIGGPILLMTQTSLRTRFLAAPNCACIAILFLLGVAFQVIENFLYKMATWYQYRGEVKPEIKSGIMYKFSKLGEDCYCIDIFFDWATFVLFFIATYMVFPILMKDPLTTGWI